MPHILFVSGLVVAVVHMVQATRPAAGDISNLLRLKHDWGVRFSIQVSWKDESHPQRMGDADGSCQIS